VSDLIKNSSWKTTGAGIAAILVAVGSVLTALTDNDLLTVPDWGSLSAAVIAGVGLIFAKDNKKA
jgi:hypothetical protein